MIAFLVTGLPSRNKFKIARGKGALAVFNAILVSTLWSGPLLKIVASSSLISARSTSTLRAACGL